MASDGAGSGAAGLPAHERVYRRVRAMILFGALAPGEAVTIQGLTESLGAGMTPVREALRRLTAEGALSVQGNRRISVPVLDAAGVDELSFARRALEPELAARAAARIGVDGIAALEARDAALDRAIAAGDVTGYLTENYRFHAALNAAAEAPVLAAMVDGLWLRFGPSLRIVCERFGAQGLPDRHKDLIAALHARDPEAAAAAMAEDVAQGMAEIAEGIGAVAEG